MCVSKQSLCLCPESVVGRDTISTRYNGTAHDGCLVPDCFLKCHGHPVGVAPVDRYRQQFSFGLTLVEGYC